jgi:hypothetical protein
MSPLELASLVFAAGIAWGLSQMAVQTFAYWGSIGLTRIVRRKEIAAYKAEMARQAAASAEPLPPAQPRAGAYH